MSEPKSWQNANPADLDELLPTVEATPVADAIAQARKARPNWASLSLEARRKTLIGARTAIENHREALERSIVQEVGKPLAEARAELTAVLAKFDFTFADAERHITDRPVRDGPHPAMVRFRPRGIAAVIAPFNFPIHLGHGATVAYLLAGNPVLFKPSPLAANTAAAYVRAMQSALPLGAIELVQGGAETARTLALHGDVRSVCFTGSVPAGRQLAVDLAEDYAKSLALELGGKNTSIVLDDADLPIAARAIADSFCLTTGQRCNATSRVLVHRSVLDDFVAALRAEVSRYQPGPPTSESTTLGPLISARSLERYQALTATVPFGEWIIPGSVPADVAGKRGHFVTPAVLLVTDNTRFEASPLHTDETFCPILAICPIDSDTDAISVHNSTPYGLTAAIFTAAPDRFDAIGDCLEVGNLYRNLPTTFSPSALPFGGLGLSGNGKPGGRDFIRFTTNEQAVQWLGI